MSKYDEYPVAKIAELLEELHPKGVPYFSIREVCSVLSSKGLPKSRFQSSGTFPVIDQSKLHTAGYSDETEFVVNSVPAVVFGDHTREVKLVGEPFIPGADGTKILSPNELIIPEYLYHSLLSVDIPNLGYSRHWSKVQKIEIPVPPLDVQEKGVAILDTFTGLDTQLRLELELRRRQTAQLRELLLDFSAESLDDRYPVPAIAEILEVLCPEGVPLTPLNQACSIKRGKRVTKRDLLKDGEYSVMSGGVTPMGRLDRYNQRANVTTVVKYGAAGFVNFIEEKFWANDVCYCLEPFENLTDRYLYFALKRREDELMDQRTNAVPPHLPTEALSTFEIPLPPLEVQEQIVAILDDFTEYETNLRQEITLRQQQREHYRDQLLTFPAI